MAMSGDVNDSEVFLHLKIFPKSKLYAKILKHIRLLDSDITIIFNTESCFPKAYNLKLKILTYFEI